MWQTISTWCVEPVYEMHTVPVPIDPPYMQHSCTSQCHSNQAHLFPSCTSKSAEAPFSSQSRDGVSPKGYRLHRFSTQTTQIPDCPHLHFQRPSLLCPTTSRDMGYLTRATASTTMTHSKRDRHIHFQLPATSQPGRAFLLYPAT